MNPSLLPESRSPKNALHITVGLAAIIAPALHSLTDVMEWVQHGFSDTQLWLNYIAFLPMTWLLLGLYAVHEPKRPHPAGLIGAILYGAAFTYFSHTTLYALATHSPSYEALWDQLGLTYTIHGTLMIGGGILFAWSVLRAGWLPKIAVRLFLAGILINLLLALVPAPDIFQTIGSAVRNLGLIGMGYVVLFKRSTST